MTPDERDRIQKLIGERAEWYQTGSRWWSCAHHCSVFIPAIFGAKAVLFLKLDLLKSGPHATDISALLAGLAALVTTVSAAGGFHTKWLTNRRSRGNLEAVKIYFAGTNASAEETLRRLTSINEEHETGILSAEPKKL